MGLPLHEDGRDHDQKRLVVRREPRSRTGGGAGSGVRAVRLRPCTDGTAGHRQREQEFERVARRRPVVVTVVRRRGRQPAFASEGQLLRQWEELGWYACFYCDGPGPLEADHVVPVSRGGLDGPGNLVPACSACNVSKSNRPAVFFTPWAHGWHSEHAAALGIAV
ncbi:HNH endonuclease [Kitasatospora sp. Ki12]